MADDPNGGRSGRANESFQEWLQSVAAAEGVSEEEVLDQMMSSYWILSELSEMMGEADHGEPVGGPEPSDQQTAPDRRQSELDADQGDASAQPDLEQIIKLATLLNESSNSTETAQQGMDPQLVGKLDQLHDDMDRLVERIEDLADQQHASEDPTESESVTPADSAEVEALADRVEELDGMVTDLAQTVEANEDRTTENFGHVEDILEYLVGRVDEFDKQIDDLANEVTLLASDHPDENSIGELKRDANRQNIQTATCEACDSVVDIGLLESAACPNCNRQFDGLDTEDRLFGLKRSHVLRLARPDPEPRATTQTSTPESTSSSEQSPAASKLDDFTGSEGTEPGDTDESETEGSSDEGFDWFEDG